MPHCCRLPLLLSTAVLVTACLLLCALSSVQAASVPPYSIRTIVGDGVWGTWRVNVTPLQASIGEPRGIVQSKKGDLYFSSMTHHDILKVEFDKQQGTWTMVTVIAGLGTGASGTGANDVLATESALTTPMTLTLIEDDTTGDVTAILIADANTHRVRKLDMKTRKITTIVGTGTQGFSVDGSLASSSPIGYPYQAYRHKPTGDLFVVEYVNNRIIRVSASDGKITTVVGKCTNSANKGDGGPAVNACLYHPTHFTMNAAGEWFIVDHGNNLIRKVDSNGDISTVVGGGSIVGEGAATNVKLQAPMNIDFTPTGEMLIAEYTGAVIRKVDSSGYVKIIAGGGSGYTEKADARTVVLKPGFVAFTPRSGILIGDQNYRISQLYSECGRVMGDQPSVCSGHGYCIATNQCHCVDGWTESDCSKTTCHGVAFNQFNACSGKGTCVGYNDCDCDDGWMGVDCSVRGCFNIMSDDPSVCSGHGTCNAPNQCQCDDGWTGDACSFTTCFGIPMNSSSVCSGHGTCDGPDNCTCEDGWTGDECSVAYCYGAMSNETSVCSGHGTCDAPDQCTCEDGWMNVDCSLTHCFGFSSNLPDKVCSGRGKCVRRNKCRCKDGYRGHKCHRPPKGTVP